MRERRGPLRFCMITTFYPPYNFGGDGLFVYHLSNELARRGHQVDVIHSIDSYRQFVHTAEVEPVSNLPGVEVHGLRSRLGALPSLAAHQVGFPLFNGKRIRALLAQPYDVVHYHNVSLVGGPGVLFHGRGHKLYTMHEYWLECPTNLLYRFGREPCERRSCIACSLVHRRPPQLWRYTPLLARAAREVDVFLAPSRFMKHRLERTNLDRPVRYLPNFAPLTSSDAVQESRPSRDVEGPYFLFAGRLEKVKGLQTLIPLFRSHSRAKLVVAGSGGFEAQLRAMAGDSPSIVFLGQISQAALAGWYERAVALLLPSLWFEVFPLVILEAFRAATPVICRNLGSPPAIIHEAAGGMTYDDEESLRQCMDRLLDDRTERDRLGRNALRAYREKWTPEAHLEAYFAIISELQETAAPSGVAAGPRSGTV